MNRKKTQQIVCVAVVAVALVAFTGSPASAKSQKKSSRSSTAAAASLGAAPPVAPAPKPGQFDTKPGPAWRTVGGKITGMQGDVYTVEDYEGNQVKLHVGQGTKHLRGDKKVGDSIRAEITRGGFANSIQ